MVWAPDSTRLAYLSERDAVTHVFLYDFAHHTETQLTKDALPDQSIKFSPDGKSLAFVRNRKELRVIDLDRKQERTGWPRGSSAGRMPGRRTIKWIAYVDRRRSRTAQHLRGGREGGAPHQVSFLANSNSVPCNGVPTASS